ncbi:hypothetical protein BraRD5C2_52450 [Bradyrhizobium sp. RD5-C2]|nr:hypothetical protein BraRD5C2_52450 [Bradyrhizobium sp. RD5-C2]
MPLPAARQEKRRGERIAVRGRHDDVVAKNVVQRGGGHGNFPGIHGMVQQMRIRIFLQEFDGIAGILLAAGRAAVYKPTFPVD